MPENERSSRTRFQFKETVMLIGLVLAGLVVGTVAAYLTRTLPVPVITRGGGTVNDGVYHISGDVVGYSAFPIPKNRGSFVDVRPLLEEGLRRYRDESMAGAYPAEENSYHMAEEEHRTFLGLVQRGKRVA